MSDSHSDHPENIAAIGVPVGRPYKIIGGTMNKYGQGGVLVSSCADQVARMTNWHATPDGIFEVNSGGSN